MIESFLEPIEQVVHQDKNAVGGWSYVNDALAVDNFFLIVHISAMFAMVTIETWIQRIILGLAPRRYDAKSS